MIHGHIRCFIDVDVERAVESEVITLEQLAGRKAMTPSDKALVVTRVESSCKFEYESQYICTHVLVA
jgi:hypothetical protein